MFQQPSVDGGAAAHHLIRIDRMAESAMELSRNLDSVQTAVQRMMETNDGHAKSYDGSMLHLLSSHESDGPTPFVVLPRAEYNQLRQEISGMKQSLADFQSAVNFEIQQLKQESSSLKVQLEKCTLERRAAAAAACKKQPLSSSSPWPHNSSWEVRPYSSVASLGDAASICSPSASSPDRGRTTISDSLPNMMSPGSVGIPGMLPLCNSLLCSGTESTSADGKQVQLLPNYDVYVNKLNLQIIVNEALSHKEGAALYVLRRLIPLVFTWNELACSRGQGLNCKSTDDIINKFPLDPMRVLACKAYMRKFCLESGNVEPSERAINQTFSHQVNYARRRVKGIKQTRKATRKCRLPIVQHHLHHPQPPQQQQQQQQQKQPNNPNNYMQM